MAGAGHLSLISHSNATGPIPKGVSALQLIETIPGLGALLQQDPQALDCRTYLDDLDRATAQEWARADTDWQNWLQQCYQTVLNVSVPQPEQGQTRENQHWHYQALQENEARLTIADHSYWISSGLTAPDL